MRIVAMTNEGQLPMMKNMLNSAMKAGFNMKLFHCYIISSDKEAAKYNTSEFKKLTTRKLEVILANMHDTTLWVDNDIVFFENCLNDVLKYRGTFVMQDDIWGYCTGFFLARPSMFGKILIQKCIQRLITNSESVENDQHVFNKLCNKSALISFIKLPLDEYPNGKVYFEDDKKSSAKILHNNYLQTTAEKVQKFKDNNLWDESDTAFNLVSKYYI
jgi:Nucleotide-diphospho-sugar transferase